MSWRTAGEGPVILLAHGITGDSRQWNRIIPQPADRYTVVARPRGRSLQAQDVAERRQMCAT